MSAMRLASGCSCTGWPESRGLAAPILDDVAVERVDDLQAKLRVELARRRRRERPVTLSVARRYPHFMQLITGNKNYSSWSLRAWLCARAFDIPFDARTIWLDEPGSAEEKRAASPACRVPVLNDGELRIWDSLGRTESRRMVAAEAWSAAEGN